MGDSKQGKSQTWHSRHDSPFVFIIKLAQANSHLATSRSRCGHNDQWTFRLYIIVLPETFVRCDKLDIMRVFLDEIMAISLDAVALQSLFEGDGGRLAIIMCNDD